MPGMVPGTPTYKERRKEESKWEEGKAIGGRVKANSRGMLKYRCPGLGQIRQ